MVAGSADVIEIEGILFVGDLLVLNNARGNQRFPATGRAGLGINKRQPGEFRLIRL